MLSARNLGYRVGARWLVRDATLHVAPGEFLVIAGANGAGKSTLLRMLSGELTPHTGDVTLNDRPLSAYTLQDLACVRACLAQDATTSFPFTAFEVALMGRTPWRGAWSYSREDRRIASECMDRVGVGSLANRTYPTLSGGEQRRVDMARVATQQPQLLLLDEPTNHLDARHQIDLMEWCRGFIREGGSVIAVLHDLNLASAHADRILLLCDGRPEACGPPEEVLTPDNLRTCFKLECVIWRHPSGCPWVVPVGAANSTTNPSRAWELTAKQGATT
jgi:iron complex transport system ATP-binding protein